jgi:hypothetical protein
MDGGTPNKKIMTIAYSVNGGSEIFGVEVNWQRLPKQRQTTTGKITFQNYAQHTWTLREMSMSQFLTLQALSGKTLTSIETNDIDARKTGKTYSAGAEMGIVNAQHVGVQAQGVTIQFRVKV